LVIPAGTSSFLVGKRFSRDVTDLSAAAVNFIIRVPSVLENNIIAEVLLEIAQTCRYIIPDIEFEQ